MAHSSAGRNWSLIRAHVFPTSHLLSTWTLRGGVMRSAISMGQVLIRFFSETAAFVKKTAHLKPIKYGLLPFGVHFKGWSSVSSQMLFSQSDRQKKHYCNPLAHARWGLIIREYGSILYVGLARAVSPTNTNFRLTFLLTRLQEALYEDLAV